LHHYKDQHGLRHVLPLWTKLSSNIHWQAEKTMALLKNKLLSSFNIVSSSKLSEPLLHKSWNTIVSWKISFALPESNILDIVDHLNLLIPWIHWLNPNNHLQQDYSIPFSPSKYHLGDCCNTLSKTIWFMSCCSPIWSLLAGGSFINVWWHSLALLHPRFLLHHSVAILFTVALVCIDTSTTFGISAAIHFCRAALHTLLSIKSYL